MVETLEAFRCGLTDTKGKSGATFKTFFAQWPEFADFRDDHKDFFENVRCGILHQAETRNGWLITRKGTLRSAKTINATLFAKSLRQVLYRYTSQLAQSDWASADLKNAVTKLNSICATANELAQ